MRQNELFTEMQSDIKLSRNANILQWRLTFLHAHPVKCVPERISSSRTIAAGILAFYPALCARFRTSCMLTWSCTGQGGGLAGGELDSCLNQVLLSKTSRIVKQGTCQQLTQQDLQWDIQLCSSAVGVAAGWAVNAAAVISV